MHAVRRLSFSRRLDRTASDDTGLGDARRYCESVGGWTNTDDPDDQVVAMCVFPDESAVDEWGIAYMSGGTVRGADLSTLFRVDPADTPPIFG